MTANNIIASAYRKGAVRNPTTLQLSDGLQDLQNMLSSWSADGLIVPSYVIENFTLTVGQSVYAIGDEAEFDTPRPNRIIESWIREDNADYVITPMSLSTYTAICDKTTEGKPRRQYYDPQYPFGNIKFDYEADTAYDFWIISEKPLTNPTSLEYAFSVPLEFNRAIIYNLAIELGIDEDNKLPPEVFKIAEESMGAIRNINLSSRIEPAILDSAVVYSGHNYMNILTGQ